MTSGEETLYARLGGYDAIAAVADNLVGRVRADARLGRFWQHRGADGIRRELQLLIDFLCDQSGGPLFYTGRDMATTHRAWATCNRRGWSRTVLERPMVLGRRRALPL